jgi:carbon-monoxide dehydrogenase large subunit
MELSGYDALRAEQDARRASNDPVQLGIGISTYTEMCGPGPVPGARARCTTGPAAGSRRRSGCLATGKVEVVTGSTPHGQGHDTAWSQIVADQLGDPFDDSHRLHGDTRSRSAAWTRTGRARCTSAGRR